MCIIINKPEGVKLDRKYYLEGFDNNKDGGGLAYIQKGKLIVEKGFFSFKDFYKRIEALEDRALVVHCRRASPGMDVSKDMCHPFVFTLKSKPSISFAVAHNGRLVWRSNKEQSDTHFFIEDYLKPMLEKYPDFLHDWQGVWTLKQVINPKEAVTPNKLVIMEYDSEANTYDTYVVNEIAGEKAHGCWFSNDSWRPWVKTTYTPPANGSGHLNFEDMDLEGWKFDAKSGMWVHDSGITADPSEGGTDSTKEKETNGHNPPFHEQKSGPAFPGPAPYVKKVGVKKTEEDVKFEYDPSLEHLTKEQQKVLIRLAVEHLQEHKIDMVGLTKRDKINWYRADIQLTFEEETKGMTVKELDKWILELAEEDDGHGDAAPAAAPAQESAGPN